MNRYLMLFNTLWRAKRMEWVLSKVWKRLATLHKVSLFRVILHEEFTNNDA
jgi:Gamma tubulin complex component C-terminal